MTKKAMVGLAILFTVVLVLGFVWVRSRTGAIAGQVLGIDGLPQGGVVVAAMGSTNSAAVSIAQTGSDGRYRLENVRPGEYYVKSGPGALFTFYPEDKARSHPRVVTLAAGQQATGIDFAVARPGSFGVRGRVTGIPANTPEGLLRIVLRSPDLIRDAPIRPDGTFEFLNVSSGKAVLGVSLLRTRDMESLSTSIEIRDHDVNDVVLALTSLELLGQVVLDGGGWLPSNSNPLEPILRIEARGAQGNVVPHRFVRSDGVFGFLWMPPDEYEIRATLLPAGYAIKSISYAGTDLLRSRLKVTSDSKFSFLRITLTTAPGPARPAVATATVLPATGDSALVVSKSGRGTEYHGAFSSLFAVTAKEPGGFRQERRLGGEWCMDRRPELGWKRPPGACGIEIENTSEPLNLCFAVDSSSETPNAAWFDFHFRAGDDVELDRTGNANLVRSGTRE